MADTTDSCAGLTETHNRAVDELTERFPELRDPTINAYLVHALYPMHDFEKYWRGERLGGIGVRFYASIDKSVGRLIVEQFASFNMMAEERANAALDVAKRGFPNAAWPEAVWAGNSYSSERHLTFDIGLTQAFACLMALDAQFVHDGLLNPSPVDLSHLAQPSELPELLVHYPEIVVSGFDTWIQRCMTPVRLRRSEWTMYRPGLHGYGLFLRLSAQEPRTEVKIVTPWGRRYRGEAYDAYDRTRSQKRFEYLGLTRRPDDREHRFSVVFRDPVVVGLSFAQALEKEMAQVGLIKPVQEPR